MRDLTPHEKEVLAIVQRWAGLCEMELTRTPHGWRLSEDGVTYAFGAAITDIAAWFKCEMARGEILAKSPPAS